MDYNESYKQWQVAKQGFYNAANNLLSATSPNWQNKQAKENEETIRICSLPTWSMSLPFAKSEIDRYITLGLSKSDIAFIVASWSLSPKDLEEANWHLHDSKGMKRDKAGRFAKDEGILL